tara:strand:- start:56409 stop:56786 length:378 start_codon:yes stop_codon:yes gene_type:complete
MRSRRVRARDGRPRRHRDDDTETTRTNEISFHSRAVLTPSIVVADASSTRGGRRESRIRPHDAMRCDAMRCVPLALPPARVARALSDARTAFIVEVVHASIAVGHTSRARVSRRSRARDVREAAA